MLVKKTKEVSRLEVLSGDFFRNLREN
jgi:hypothetical protein